MEDWRVGDVYFTSSNSTIGELFWLGVVTLAGGTMRLTCNYRTGYVSDREVGSFMHKLRETLLCL